MKKRILSMLLAMCLVLTLLPGTAFAAISTSGYCGGEGDGTNLQWTFDTSTGILTISGTGAMARNAFNSFFGFDAEIATAIQSVVIERGATSIGMNAFASCSNLSSISIPNSVTLIDTGAFGYCESLDNVLIPESVTSIGSNAFFGCSALSSVTIPNSVTDIGFCAFEECSALRSVTIPASVTSIGYSPFNNCVSLTSIEVDPNNSAYTSVDGVLFSKDMTQLISCPAGKSGEYVIPDSVTSIGPYAFYGCANLDLGDVTIPNGVMTIEDQVFTYCTGLNSIIIPDGATSIGGSAFAGCANLRSVTIPSSVTSIAPKTFNLCDSLTDIYYAGSEQDWNNIAGMDVLEIAANVTIHYDSTTAAPEPDPDPDPDPTPDPDPEPTPDPEPDEDDDRYDEDDRDEEDDDREEPTEKPTEKPTEPATETPETPAEPEPEMVEPPFADVSDTDWYYEGVKYAYNRGIMGDAGSGDFAPNAPTTRAMLWTMLARLDGVDTTGGASWYEKGRAWAVENGVSDGTDPDGPITREQLVVMLWRLAGSPAGSGDLSSFSDSGSVSSWAADAVRWAVGNGLLTGMGDGAFQPQSGATRAQVATLMMRFCEHMGI